jgi:hypothetical protein
MNRDLIPNLESLVERLRSWQGELIEVTESLSRLRSAGHDRHFATSSRFHMRLKSVGITFSGGALDLGGEVEGQTVWYQATVERLQELSVQEREVLFVEQFEQHTERRSVFKLLEHP